MSRRSCAGYRGEVVLAVRYRLQGASCLPGKRGGGFSSKELFFCVCFFLLLQGMFSEQNSKGGLELPRCRGRVTGSSRQPTKMHLQDKPGHPSSSMSFLARAKCRGLQVNLQNGAVQPLV